jgi:hypothetical protein
LGDDFDHEPLDNTVVEMTDQINQDGNNDNDEEEKGEEEVEVQVEPSDPLAQE